MNCLVYKKKLTRINVKYLIAFSLMMFCLFVVFPQGKDSSAAAYDKVMLAANAAFNAGEYAKSEALWRQCLGYTAKIADCAVIVPTVDAELVTPHSEAFQAVVWHCLVSHPKLKVNATKW